MKKNYVKYLGVTSTALLSVAPVVTPIVQNALNAAETKTVQATDSQGVNVPVDLSGQNDYSKVLQQAIKAPLLPFTSINGSLVNGAIQNSSYNADTLLGLVELAKITNQPNQDYDDVLMTNNGIGSSVTIKGSDLMKYLFTNTDGSTRTDTSDFYSAFDQPVPAVALNTTRAAGSKGKQIHDAAQFIYDKLGSNVKDVLGTGIFGDPNKAKLSIEIDGQTSPNPVDLARQGRIVVTLKAESGKQADGKTKKAEAFMVLKNSNVLLANAGGDGSLSPETDTKKINKFANTANLNDYALLSDDGLINTKRGSTDFSIGTELSDPEGTSSTTDPIKSAYDYYFRLTNKVPLDAENTYPKIDKLDDLLKTDVKAYTEKHYVEAYATDTIVVPEGTTLDTIVDKLQKVKYQGAPSVGDYGTSVNSEKAVAFDNVDAKSANSADWVSRLSGENFSSVTEGSTTRYTAKRLMDKGTPLSSIVARPGRMTIDVPVKGDLFLPTKDNGGSGYTFLDHDSSHAFVKNVPATAKVNVVVYSNPGYWGNIYTLGTLPSFAFFAPAATGELVPTFYDNGQTVKETDLPQSLRSNVLKLSANDPNFVDPATNAISKNKLNSFFVAAFGQAVKNKQILISDEDVKSSITPIDTNNLKEDNDFPNAKFYTIRPDDKTNAAGDGSRFTVDSSAVDLTKPGKYDVKVTYTNDKNGAYGLGSESSTITFPVTVNATDDPAFYFIGGVDKTIKVGESFNPLQFKVARSLDEINKMVADGTANDGKDFVNDPMKTGVDVSISGSVNTNVPGTYTLVYTATNTATGKKTTLNRRINVINTTKPSDPSKPNTPNVTEFKAIGYVNYIPGYGINVWDSPNGKFTGQRLDDMTSWKISQKAVIDGKTWYEVGRNQWVDGTYISLSPVSHMKPLSGSVRINYVPGYGVRVYKSTDGTQPTEQFLQHGTEWKVFGEMNGYYNVGADQWIKVEYGQLN